MSLIWRGRGCFCSGRRVSILQPPYVLLLSPRLAAGPAAGSSAFSRSVAQHLLVLRLAALRPPIWQGVLAPASGSPAAAVARSITPPALVSWPGAPFSGCGRTCLWFRYGLFSFRVRACLSAYCSQAAMPGSVGEPSSYACAAVAGSSAWSRLVAMPRLVVFRLCRAMSALPLPLLGHLP